MRIARISRDILRETELNALLRSIVDSAIGLVGGERGFLLLAEKELGEWRTKIETAEGEIRYYNSLISLSTLTITLQEKEIRAASGVVRT